MLRTQNSLDAAQRAPELPAVALALDAGAGSESGELPEAGKAEAVRVGAVQVEAGRERVEAHGAGGVGTGGGGGGGGFSRGSGSHDSFGGGV